MNDNNTVTIWAVTLNRSCVQSTHILVEGDTKEYAIEAAKLYASEQDEFWWDNRITPEVSVESISPINVDIPPKS